MKRSFALLLILLTASTMVLAGYIDNFSAAVDSWNRGKIDDALSLTKLSLSSTVNVSSEAPMWYFTARLDMMSGKLNDAKAALRTAVNVFKPETGFNLLDSLANASVTVFSPVTSLSLIDSIKGVDNGEIFYSPISAAIAKDGYYILDAANRFVVKFGQTQIHYPLGVDSTPTAMVYARYMNAFYVSFENGTVYRYSSSFDTKSVFLSGLSYPVVFCSDNAGRVYVGEYGKDRVDAVEYDGTVFRRFDLLSKRVHVFSYGKVSGGVFYLMDLTDREIRRFNVVTGNEDSPVPFPKGPMPVTFQVIGRNVCFINSENAVIGGITFPLKGSSSVFSSFLDGETLLTTDPANNRVNIYEFSTANRHVFPLVDGIGFKNGNTVLKFRIFDPIGNGVENPKKISVTDNGFQAQVKISYDREKVRVYAFPKLSDLMTMDQNFKNVVITDLSTLESMHDYMSTLLLRNVTLYVVESSAPSPAEKMLVHLTGGAFISQSETGTIKNFALNAEFDGMTAEYPTVLPAGDMNYVNISYGSDSNLVDTVYYTNQNLISK